MKKEKMITLSPELRTSVKFSNPFSWSLVARVYNRLPLGITPCKDVYEAKMYTVVLLVFLSLCFLPLVGVAGLVYSSAKKK